MEVGVASEEEEIKEEMDVGVGVVREEVEIKEEVDVGVVSVEVGVKEEEWENGVEVAVGVKEEEWEMGVAVGVKDEQWENGVGVAVRVREEEWEIGVAVGVKDVDVRVDPSQKIPEPAKRNIDTVDTGNAEVSLVGTDSLGRSQGKPWEVQRNQQGSQDCGTGGSMDESRKMGESASEKSSKEWG